ncbi:MAG: hypothetical protein QMD17_13975 [Rhodocyclaceae bacterium]|nr:hypothetical protein [Rhodocyclaceae bacterium]
MAFPVDDHYGCAAGGIISAGRFIAPSWAPAAGQIKSISYAAGAHPDGRGATLAEISPAFEDWNPNKPSVALYGNSYQWGSYYGYCGSSFNTDSRQIVLYGTGHASINVCAPSCFDLKDLRWKWLDTPLPFDAFGQVWAAGIPQPPTRLQMESYYPPEQYDYDWGDINGDWSGWPAGYGRPGKIQPVPNHTRATMMHIPAAVAGNAQGALLVSGAYSGVLSNSGNGGSHIFDYDTKTWSRTANRFTFTGSRNFDPVTQKAVAFGTGETPSAEFRVFDYATKTWATRTASASLTSNTDHGGNVLHQKSRLLIIPNACNAAGQVSYEITLTATHYKFWAVDFDAVIGTGSFAASLLNITVAAGFPITSVGNNRYLGWSYCPEDECLYCINGEQGSNKYWKLSPPSGAITQSDYLSGTWEVTEHVFADGVVQSPGATYTPRSMMYNRMQWDRVSRAFVFWPDSVDGPVQAWRPERI